MHCTFSLSVFVECQEGVNTTKKTPDWCEALVLISVTPPSDDYSCLHAPATRNLHCSQILFLVSISGEHLGLSPAVVIEWLIQELNLGRVQTKEQVKSKGDVIQ